MDARLITEKLRGRWHGTAGNAPCPICQQDGRRDQNALSIKDGADGRLLLHCFRGKCNFVEILAAAGLRPGDYTRPTAQEAARQRVEATETAKAKAEAAARVWASSVPMSGTLAERYLQSRAITGPWSGALRFHPNALHDRSTAFPCMVARVEGVAATAVHRTFLDPAGNGKASATPAKKALGSISGGAVRLRNGAGSLLVGEGIESTLSAAALIPEATSAVWAALSAPGMRSLVLPSEAGRLVIAVDIDANGTGEAAANALAARATSAGWRVAIARPAAAFNDFNDMARGARNHG